MKIFRIIAPLLFTALFVVPLLASAQVNTGGCTSEGPACSFQGITGTCLSNGAGGFWCNTAGGTQSIPGTSGGGINPTTGGVQKAPTGGGGINLSKISPYATSITNLINSILVPVLMAIAFITFLWGVFKYFIWGADNETERAIGKQWVLWGIIGFVVILSIWGLVNLVGGTLGLQLGGSAPKPPTF